MKELTVFKPNLVHRQILIIGFLISLAVFSVTSSLIHFICFLIMIAYFIIDNSLLTIDIIKIKFSFNKRCYSYDYFFYIFGFILFYLYEISLCDNKLIGIFNLVWNNVFVYFGDRITGLNEIMDKREHITQHIFFVTFLSSLLDSHFQFSLDLRMVLVQIMSTYFISFIVLIGDPVVIFEHEGIKIAYIVNEKKGKVVKMPKPDVVIPNIVVVHGYSFIVDEIDIYKFRYRIAPKLSFEVPSTVEKIGPQFLSQYKYVELPESLKILKIPVFNFYHKPSLIKVNENSKYFHNEGPLLVQNYPSEVIHCGKHARRAFIRRGAVGIGDHSFERCLNLESIHIPASVERIEKEAFLYCFKLKRVTFAPNSRLKFIGESAFYKTEIETITLPSSIEEIGSKAFDSRLSVIKISSPNNCLRKLGKKFIETDIKPLKIDGDACVLPNGIKLINFPIQLIQDLDLNK